MSEAKLLTLAEIQKQLKGTQFFSLNTQFGYAMITDSDERITRLFKIKDDKFEEVDVKAMAKMIAEYLSEHVTLEKLLQDKILHKPLETILQLKKRVEKKGKVREHKGCYYLKIKGERGPAIKLDL